MGPPFERRVAAACDSALDFIVLAFAAWTLAYIVCLVLHAPAELAAAATVIALVPCAWFVRARTAPTSRAAPAPSVVPTPPVSPASPTPPVSPAPRISPAHSRAASLVCALAGATVAALGGPWPIVWVVWIAAAVAALAAPADGAPRPVTRIGAGVALAWAGALSVLSLLVVDPDADDALYVHTSTWVAARGHFPARDVIFSDERLDALFFPPWSSLEGLAGTAARLTGLSAPTVVYLIVAPVATALAVLALWRLLRTWGVAAPALALSTALIFLLASAAGEQRTAGDYFIARIWQGKAIFGACLVPLVFALVAAHAREPARRSLVLLAAAGVSAVGLTSSGLLVVPLIALGGFAPLALRRPHAAGAGFVALAGYPLLALAATFVLGMRNPDLSQDGIQSAELARLALGIRVPLFVTVAAILAVPALLPRASGRTVAGVSVIVGIALAPEVPAVVNDVAGFGESLWRVTWALPIAALVGAGSVSLRGGPLPAVAVAAGMVAWAVHVGLPGTSLSPTPALKLSTIGLDDARPILAHAGRGDLVLAPQHVSIPLLVLSADVTAVDPRDFYTFAAGRLPHGSRGVHAWTRVHLQGLADPWLPPARGRRSLHRDPAWVDRALGVLDVDIACVPRGRPAVVQTLRAAGYSGRFTTPRLVCLRQGPAAAPSPRGVSARPAR